MSDVGNDSWLRHKEWMRDHLQRQLSPDMRYHGVHHTLDDVLPAIERLCDGEGIMNADRALLRWAGLFHDAGFLQQYNENEALGAQLARLYLAQWGLESVAIEHVCELIMATALREVNGAWLQVPGNDLLKQILCDADLDNLGRGDFWEVSKSLREELASEGRHFTEEAWLSRQVLFVGQHRYFTETQKAARDLTKSAHLRELRRQWKLCPAESRL